MPNQTMLDAAYQFSKAANTAASHGEAKEKLQEAFPQASWSEIVEAYLKASELVEKCYEVGDMARRQNISDDRATEILRRQFPGFSQATYRDALTLGWFLSR